MNAKKIMGAVLVALLAAALFVGAGAAAGLDDMNGKTVFVYQKNSTLAGSTWNNGANSITFDADGVISGKNIVEGAYVNGENTIYVKYPTAAISAIATTQNNDNYSVIGGTLFKQTGTSVNISAISPAAGVGVGDIFVTFPNGTVKRGSDVFTGWSLGAGADAAAGKLIISIPAPAIANLPTGDYKVYAGFDVGTGNGNLTTYTPAEYRVAKDIYSFTVADESSLSITANIDTVHQNGAFSLTVIGMPGNTYSLNLTEGVASVVSVNGNAASFTNDKLSITMPNNGIATVYLNAGDEAGYLTFQIDDVEVTLEVIEGTITAAADAEAYFIGNDVKITGTSTAGTPVYFYVAGTNKEFQKLTIADNDADVKGNEFEFEISGSYFQKFDAGTYTVYISNNQTTDAKYLDVYTTVALVLKQPFISVTEAPSVAVQGTDYVVTGTAEAATHVYAYVFGTNYFEANTNNASAIVGGNSNIGVTVKDSAFTIKVKGIETEEMSAGQYFMVVQHPMYDKIFNIWAKNSDIVLNDTTLFNVTDRQKANAAEALCQALDTENIDDMYVKLSFVVAAPQSVINPIPETVAQGEKLTVSGSTNMGKGELVTVEMLSTAFAAVPKATVGSASFISLTTKTDENGNWEVTFDTTGLNVDEYTVTAAVEQLGTATAKVNVVEAAPEQPDTPDTPDVPDTPDTPDEPEAPATPGFGALASLAGLGAVAVLLLRRE
ncbi:MAG: hypothetical protein IKK56_03625 [Methanocorpusculum sp.]|nr:hypothetical protein [Methanocorpusculum sp.]